MPQWHICLGYAWTGCFDSFPFLFTVTASVNLCCRNLRMPEKVTDISMELLLVAYACFYYDVDRVAIRFLVPEMDALLLQGLHIYSVYK